MSYVRGSARSENGENAGIIQTNSICGVVLDLEAGIKSINAHVPRTTRLVIHLGAVERGASAIGIGNDEGVLGEGAQDSVGIIEEFEDLVASVGDSHGDLHVLQSVDFDIRG